MTAISSTAQNYFFAHNKSLEYELRLTELKLAKLESAYKSLEHQLHAKEFEIFKLNDRLRKLEDKPKQIRNLKERVEQLQKDFQTQISSVLKNFLLRNNLRNPKFSSTLPSRDSCSEISRQSKATFDIQKLQRNSIGSELQILQEAFNHQFSESDDLKSILFHFIKNVGLGCNLPLLIQSSTSLFEELQIYLSKFKKSTAADNILMDFISESKQIFSDDDYLETDL